jgi:hypothetical protein
MVQAPDYAMNCSKIYTEFTATFHFQIIIFYYIYVTGNVNSVYLQFCHSWFKYAHTDYLLEIMT